VTIKVEDKPQSEIVITSDSCAMISEVHIHILRSHQEGQCVE
jgi:hypothetical protein